MTFNDFYYGDYIVRHQNKMCRFLHVIGIPISLGVLVLTIWWQNWWLLPLVPLPIYFFAWFGHLAAHNKPTFFQHPIWSFRGYWKMIGGIFFGASDAGERRGVSPPVNR